LNDSFFDGMHLFDLEDIMGVDEGDENEPTSCNLVQEE